MVVKKTFPIMGLGCAACVARVEKVLGAMEGVSEVSVSLASSTVQVEYDTSLLTERDLCEVVKNAGYELLVQNDVTEANVPSDNRSSADLDKVTRVTNTKMQKSPEDVAEELSRKAYGQLRIDAVSSLALSLLLMIVGMFIGSGRGNGMTVTPLWKGIIMAALAAPVVFWFGRRFFSNAFVQLRHGSANMDTLVALSISVSYFFSLFNLCFPGLWTSRGLTADLYFESSAMIVAFVLLGRCLEERARNSTTSAVRKLKSLQPRTVLLKVGNMMKEVDISSIEEGDTVIVHGGMRVAVDGTVIEGSARMDESMLTGESVAAEKAVGASVYAGTICMNGDITIRTVKVGGDTVLSSIIDMVREAQGSKASIQRKVDKVAAVFVPVILSIAVLSLVLWCVCGGDDAVSRGILALVTVLVIACPCSLGLATPAAIIAGIGRAAECGVLIRDADALQTAAGIDVVLLDKTGTLTTGEVGSDRLKEGSKDAVSELRAMGVRSVMLSGDAEDRARKIAEQAGIGEVRSGMLPGDKLAVVKDCHASGLKVAMVGDGINDSAALAEADFSMAMGNGSDIAMDSAMATVVSSDLRKLPQIIRLSAKTGRIVKENLFWAFFYNALAVPAAAFGLVSPMIAALCMALSSVCVVCNALRLKFCRL